MIKAILEILSFCIISAAFTGVNMYLFNQYLKTKNGLAFMNKLANLEIKNGHVWVGAWILSILEALIVFWACK